MKLLVAILLTLSVIVPAGARAIGPHGTQGFCWVPWFCDDDDDEDRDRAIAILNHASNAMRIQRQGEARAAAQARADAEQTVWAQSFSVEYHAVIRKHRKGAKSSYQSRTYSAPVPQPGGATRACAVGACAGAVEYGGMAPTY